MVEDDMGLMINWKNKEEVRNYYKHYRENNRDKYNKSQKKYAFKHQKYYKEKNKEHNLKNKLNGYFNKKQKTWSKNNPEKIKAYNKINNNKKEWFICSWCESKNNLNFHHTNYIQNLGFVLCVNCHRQLHRGMMLG